MGRPSGSGGAAIAHPVHAPRLREGRAVGLRQHPRTLSLQYQQGVSRSERDNAVEAWLRHERPPRWSIPCCPHACRAGHWVRLLQRVALASGRPDPLPRQHRPCGETGVRYVLAARRLHPPGRGAGCRGRAQHGDDLLRAAPVSSLTGGFQVLGFRGRSRSPKTLRSSRVSTDTSLRASAPPLPSDRPAPISE